MDHNHADQEWNKLHAHIDRMFGKYLRDSVNMIEHKPRHTIHLLETSADDRKDLLRALKAK